MSRAKPGALPALMLLAGCLGSAPERSTSEAAATSCSATEPAVVAVGLIAQGFEAATSFKVDDRYLYFLAQPPSGRFGRVDKEGGPIQLIDEVRDEDRLDYAVTPSRIIFQVGGLPVEFGDLQGELRVWDKELRRLPNLAGVVHSCADLVVYFGITAASNGDLFWVQGSNARSGTNCEGGGAFVVGLRSGASEPELLAVKTEDFWQNLRAVPGKVYFGAREGLVRTAGSGGGGVALVGVREFAQPPVAEMAVNDLSIFYSTVTAENGDGTTYRYDFATGTAVPILSSRLFGLVEKDGFLYGALRRSTIADPNVNIVRLKPNGHGFLALAKAHNPPDEVVFGEHANRGAIAVDDSFVYYVDASRDRILKVCR
jgi:hypothetical protein